MDRSVQFRRWKTQCLSKADLSRKGSVDEDVVELVQFLNARDQFFTTSSCSGRILLLNGGINGFEVQKQNCCWLLVTHKSCVKDDVKVHGHFTHIGSRFLISVQPLGDSKMEQIIEGKGSYLGENDYHYLRLISITDILALKKASADTILKFEPFVLHVQCRQLKDAQILHTVAIDSGFRNSGITVGKRGKTILAVRSTHSLEVPLSHKGKLMVTEEYIDFLVNVANQKMEENKRRIERFYNCLQHALEKETMTNSHSKIKKENNPTYIPKKKRNLEKIHGKCITGKNENKLENDDDDDELGISVIFPGDY